MSSYENNQGWIFYHILAGLILEGIVLVNIVRRDGTRLVVVHKQPTHTDYLEHTLTSSA